MKKYLNAIFLVLSGITGAAQVPVVTGIETTIVDAHTKEYTVQLSVYEVGGEYDFPVLKNNWVGFTHKHISGSMESAGMFESGYYVVCSSGTCDGQSESFHQAVNKAWEKMGRPGTVLARHVGDLDIPGECVGWMYSPPKEYAPWGEVQVPPGGCIVVPPPTEWCAINSPALEFSHGELSIREANGNSKLSSASINCTIGTKIRLKLSNADSTIALTHGRSRINIWLDEAWRDFPVTLDVASGNYLLELKSTLEGIGDDANGFISGSAVLMIEPA